MTPLVLSLFPGIGLLDIPFEEAGFCVVRGPDALWGGDIKSFHPPAGRFDGVIGGPPCQAFSRLRHIVAANGYATAENLIPEFERVVREAAPEWFVMENVPDAPEPQIPGHHGYHIESVVLNNRWFGGAQNRERRFTFGSLGRAIDPWRHFELVPLECVDWQPAVMASDGGRYQSVRLGGSGKPKRAVGCATKPLRTIEDMCRLQGLPEDFLSEAPFTVEGKRRVIGNGVPLLLGRAIATVIQRALYPDASEEVA